MAEINLVPIEYREKKDKWKKVFSKTTFLVLFLVIITLLVYGGVIIYKKNLNKGLEEIQQQIVELSNKRAPDEEGKIIDLDAKIAVLKEVFQVHTYWSKVLEKIEDLTAQDVYFLDAKFVLESNRISIQISALTDTYTSLARQMLGLQEEPMIQEVEISNLSLSEDGEIKFGISLAMPLKVLLINGDNKTAVVNKTTE